MSGTSSRARWHYGPRGHALHRSLHQLRARPLSTLTTLLALGITLALPALVLFTADTIAELGSRTVGGESLTLYLDPSLDDLDGATLAAALAERADVSGTRYISRDEALATFRERSDVDEALDVLGDNPLPGAIVVRAERSGDGRAASESGGDGDGADLAALADELGALPGVERVQLDLRWVQRLRAVLALAQRLAALLAAFLMLSALLVITNTVRLELARRRDELELARLLGGSGAFIYRPLFYTAALYGLLGGLLAAAFALAALSFLAGPAAELARLYDGVAPSPWPAPAEVALVALASTALGLLGALLSLYGPSRHSFARGA